MPERSHGQRIVGIAGICRICASASNRVLFKECSPQRRTQNLGTITCAMCAKSIALVSAGCELFWPSVTAAC
jgi:hypothetical protein